MYSEFWAIALFIGIASDEASSSQLITCSPSSPCRYIRPKQKHSRIASYPTARGGRHQCPPISPPTICPPPRCLPPPPCPKITCPPPPPTLPPRPEKVCPPPIPCPKPYCPPPPPCPTKICPPVQSCPKPVCPVIVPSPYPRKLHPLPPSPYPSPYAHAGVGQANFPKYENYHRHVKRMANISSVSLSDGNQIGQAESFCNDERLREIMITNMHDDPVVSKESIQKATRKEFNENFNIICSTGIFAFLTYADSYCKVNNEIITCYAFKAK